MPERPTEQTHCAGRSASAHDRTPMVDGACPVCGEQDWPGDGSSMTDSGEYPLSYEHDPAVVGDDNYEPFRVVCVDCGLVIVPAPGEGRCGA